MVVEAKSLAWAFCYMFVPVRDAGISAEESEEDGDRPRLEKRVPGVLCGEELGVDGGPIGVQNIRQ